MNRNRSFLHLAFMLATATSANAVTATKLFPEHVNGLILKGQYVRKGTIGATFNNVSALDELLLSNGPEKDIKALLKNQRGLGRPLEATDLFKTQPIINWLKDEKRPGRIIVTVLILEECPELLTEPVRRRLKALERTIHPLVKNEIKKVLG